jgi:ABC-type transport system involved in multi-copper enzyme maturation permease subunit
MGRPGLILVKDLKEAFGQRAMRFRALLGTAIMPVVLAFSQSGTLHGEPILRTVLSLDLLLLAFSGSTVAIITAAAALAGEKERRTAEALLAAPVSDLELFIGKALAAWLPGTLTGYLAQALFLATWWSRDPWEPGLLSTAQWLVVIAAPPLMALVVATLGLIVSARSATVLSAMQLSALLSTPVAGACLWLGHRAITGGPPERLTFFLAALAAAVVLTVVGVRVLNREAIVMRL